MKTDSLISWDDNQNFIQKLDLLPSSLSLHPISSQNGTALCNGNKYSQSSITRSGYNDRIAEQKKTIESSQTWHERMSQQPKTSAKKKGNRKTLQQKVAQLEITTTGSKNHTRTKARRGSSRVGEGGAFEEQPGTNLRDRMSPPPSHIRLVAPGTDHEDLLGLHLAVHGMNLGVRQVPPPRAAFRLASSPPSTQE